MSTACRVGICAPQEELGELEGALQSLGFAVRALRSVRAPGGAPELHDGPIVLPVCYSRSTIPGDSGPPSSRTAWALAPRAAVSALGIDAERSPVLDPVLWDEFFSPLERARLETFAQEAGVLDSLRLAWCVKEAAWKSLRGEGPSEFRDWTIESLTVESGGVIHSRVSTVAERGMFRGQRLSIDGRTSFDEAQGCRVALAVLPRRELEIVDQAGGT